ncbi:MAG: ABC transporter ATP-binding protein [Candidatus Omnitrophica bacterium]|nr:ABC transporter ATP-binding protein [Candidatus Omnitrophota bacterium]
MKALRFILEIAKKFPSLLVGNTFLLLVESLIGMAAIIAIAPLIDFFFAGQQQASLITGRLTAAMKALGLPLTLGSFLTVFLLLQVLKSGAGIVVRYALLRTRFLILRALILDTVRAFFTARWQFFSEHKQGTLLNTLLHEMEAVGGSIWVMTLLFANAIQVLCYLLVAFVISWQVTSISLGAAVLFTAPFLLLGRLTYRLGRSGVAATNQMTAVIQESLTLAKVIVGFGNQRHSLRALEQAFDAHRHVACKSLTIHTSTPLMQEPLGILVLLVTVLVGRRLGVPLSDVAVLFWALRNCVPLLGSVITHRNALLNFVPSYEQIQHLEQRARALQQSSGSRPFTGFRDAMTVERVSFAYPGQEPVLREIILTIPKGKVLALVGESGSGKSTLIDLLMGFHEPLQGRIAIDGIPLEAFDVESYRQRIGYVPQDSVLFNMSIRENLRWAKPDATEREIREACHQANADEFIERFPDGYDTVVGDRGVRLSGGQCQRVALARAILRKPDLLILDEATSSLDSHSERLIQQAIETIAQETTVVVIAHRLSTITKADHIYVLHGGRIVEEGTYQELVRQEGHFSQMTQLQMLEASAGG